MKEYVCTICGYVHVGELPDDFKCPICGAGRDAFRLKEDNASSSCSIEKPDFDKELSPMEMSIICSNLARGCEKQYMQKQSEEFKMLSEFFRSKAAPYENPSIDKLISLIEKDLSSGFPYGNSVAREYSDRGSLRCQTWSEKVTRMLKSLLDRYKSEGDKMLENTNIYVCNICGFVYMGNTPPELCPVCKVPAWKFEKVERRRENG